MQTTASEGKVIVTTDFMQRSLINKLYLRVVIEVQRIDKKKYVQ